MEELREELNKLREEVAELRLLHKPATKHRKEPCQGVTGKGTPCRNGALPGMTCCRMHSREPKPAKEPKKKKEPKPKKIQPEHTHELGETCPTCPLCDTHGDVMDPTLPESQFESDENIEERLRMLLETEEL